VGRFLQEDSFRGDGLNLYAYVSNNPIMYTDPTGHGKDYIENQFSQYDIGDRTLLFANNGQAFLIEIEEWKMHDGKYKGFKFVNASYEDFGNANKIYVSPKEWASMLIGFTPVDMAKDFVDFIKGEDTITGDKINRWLLGAMIFTPEAVDIAIKQGAKNGDEILDVFKKNKNILGIKKAEPNKIINALSKFKGKKMLFGDKTFLLDKSGMKHILERHHPNFWNGSIKKTQSFFDENMSIDDITNAIHDIMKQNRDTLIERGTKGMYQIKGTYNGADYVVGFKNGRIGQFYPE
jgi:Glu-tRNA(Gln) amidotransferase subunit E-like FAD-binding protein